MGSSPFALLVVASAIFASASALPRPQEDAPSGEVAAGVIGAKKFATAVDCNVAVAFSGAGASAAGEGKGSKLHFATDLTDKGVGWGRDSGEFTAFCPGLYQFAFSSGGHESKARLALKKKLSSSDEWKTVVSTGTGGGANVVLLNMDVGDQTAVFLEDGEFPSEKPSPSVTFSGFRIAKK